ncbi:MAG: 6,7-dimethyl-8-ribityllumazine synthase [Candidatus Kentron sp. G]|nr:MAG: 6,7-dimethyl-8-ribityllumazine synthase [Candidatus Kentron sp. G]VFN06430.1 MAG: 6,7-dimethyl-8-ribityllumazine synthase [Candidatus Kentron sp. G]VFN06913.1 MAG: 6,7-dimethyl-8-ribityllumazine synthase [Candidatus Kentron sp. G]
MDRGLSPIWTIRAHKRVQDMPKNIAVVIASFHKKEADEMLDEVRNFAKHNDIRIVKEKWVPGSMEKPLALKRILNDDGVDGAVALGIIESGETKHGFVMAQAVISAIIGLQLELMKPIGVGIIGPEILPSQIPSRVRPFALRAIQVVVESLE